jgi:hypothetical protein
MLEPDDGKLSSPVLRGLAPSNGGWLLGNYGRKATTGQRAFRQRILQSQGWHPNCEATVQLLASRRQRARVNSTVSICKFS